MDKTFEMQGRMVLVRHKDPKQNLWISWGEENSFIASNFICFSNSKPSNYLNEKSPISKFEPFLSRPWQSIGEFLKIISNQLLANGIFFSPDPETNWLNQFFSKLPFNFVQCEILKRNIKLFVWVLCGSNFPLVVVFWLDECNKRHFRSSRGV